MSYEHILKFLLLQVFFATVGAEASISVVLATAPQLFLFCFAQIFIHLGIVLLLGRFLFSSYQTHGRKSFFHIPLNELLLSSNAAVGGPTTASGMALSMSWRPLYVPALLVGTAGYASATFIAIAIGCTTLKAIV